VVLGDFDDMGDLLTGNNIGSTEYDGFIVQATYEPADSSLHRGDLALTVEGLLTDTAGSDDLKSYNAVFVNSGTRGLNAYTYNDMMEPDDALLQDAENLQRTCDYVEGGGSLIVSDWAYDLVEFCWPDAIEFFGDNTVVDAAQVGVADDSVLATVHDEGMKSDLGPSVTIDYNYSAWTVIQSVGADTEVLLSANVPYQPSATEVEDELQDVPVMVRFQPGRGQVVFTTFHWAAQTAPVASGLLFGAVDGLNEGDGAQSGEVAGGGDSGAS
jgi:hypothetical protein